MLQQRTNRGTGSFTLHALVDELQIRRWSTRTKGDDERRFELSPFPRHRGEEAGETGVRRRLAVDAHLVH